MGCYKTILIMMVFTSGCGGGGSSLPSEPPAAQLAPIISTFSFLVENNSDLEADVALTINSGSITGRIPINISVTDLIASFQHSGSSVSITSIDQQSGSTANDFSTILTYTTSGSDGQTTDYQVDLTRFTDLPIVYLTTDFYAAIDSKDDYVQGESSIDGGRHFDDLAPVEMKIRGRGNSTWYLHPKKPFQMKLSDKAEFLGMPNDKKWLFLAEYSDKTMLRNKISFEMGYISNLDWTPQGRFAEVYINDEYNGTYNITQKVEESDNRVPLGDMGYLLELDQLERTRLR